MLMSSMYSTNMFNINFIFNALTVDFGVGEGVYVALAFFFTGIFSLVFFSTNLLMSVLFAELIFVGGFIGFVSTAVMLGDPAGMNYGLYLLCAAAVDSAIGLVLTLNTYRLHQSVAFSKLTTLRG